jgi:phosphatidylethanolamine/phosphatidyl-N-methylethanolamine N-methyltransferase
MRLPIAASMVRQWERKPAWIFFKRWLANPLGMASVTPSSAQLARLMAERAVCGKDEVLVEFGAGTGAITTALIKAFPNRSLYSVERDPELADYLRANFPDVHVLEGDVRDVASMLPAGVAGRVGTVVVGIPIVILPTEAQRAVTEAIFSIMPKGRFFLAYTYALHCPLDARALGLVAKRVAFAPANIPPATVWSFRKA